LLMMDEVREDELLAPFTEQAGALAAGGAEGLVIETMADLAEAQLAVAAARTTGLPVVACMTYDSGADLDRTMMGVTPEQAAEALTSAGADVIGANCGQGIAGYVAICRRLRAATPLPLWIKANAGTPQVVDGQVVYRTTPAEFARHGPALVEAGANFIGGCCGTGPVYIAALTAAVRS
jgi:5-methyltetrahydrofolate--homocysteine methyltransferase